MDGYLVSFPAAVRDQFSTIVIMLLAFIGIWVYARRDRNLPPGPVILPLELLRGNFLRPFIAFRGEYGPIFSFRLRVLTVVVNNASLVREALVDQADVFTDRFQSKSMKRLAGGFKGSVLFSNGPGWKELRRITVSAMRSFGVGKRSFAEKINSETKPMLDAIAETKGEPFNPTDVFHNAVSNMICSISFGRRFEYTDQKAQEVLSALRHTIQENAPSIASSVFPFMVYLPHYRVIWERIRIIREFIQGQIEEHRSTFDPNDVRDIIDVFLLEAAGREKAAAADDGSRPELDTLWKTIYDLFGAGSDTTTGVLLWAIAIFCHHPSVQDKMYKEITELIGVERLPSYEDRHKLPYTEAVLLEIQRFRTVVPLVSHRALERAMVGGYHIPKGARLVINYWAVHRDPETWEEPELFRPERYLDDLGKVIQNESHFPFGLGRRACIGESLAKMEMFLFLTSLVQRFRFCTPVGSPLPSLAGIRGLTLIPPPYDVCAEARM